MTSNQEDKIISKFLASIGPWRDFVVKGLTFTKRKSSLKMLKDLYGIWYVASQLGEFSDHALDEFNGLAKQHSKWFKTFQKNLQNWLENASPNDWSKLEAQDPYGRLRKLNFEQIMRKLLT